VHRNRPREGEFGDFFDKDQRQEHWGKPITDQFGEIFGGEGAGSGAGCAELAPGGGSFCDDDRSRVDPDFFCSARRVPLQKK
jgi:hypothetical protein